MDKTEQEHQAIRVKMMHDRVRHQRIRAYEQALNAMEVLIDCTPSGDLRNDITGLNILLMELERRVRA